MNTTKQYNALAMRFEHRTPNGRVIAFNNPKDMTDAQIRQAFPKCSKKYFKDLEKAF